MSHTCLAVVNTIWVSLANPTNLVNKMKHPWLLIFAFMFLPLGEAQAQLLDFQGTLSAANQNGSDPDFFTDADGVIPSSATGTIFGTLDTSAFTFDFNLAVDGITQSDLMNFGPNATPIHLHLPAQRGAFGPIAVDLTLGATASDFTAVSYTHLTLPTNREV